jgi:hypothetical protein
MFVTLLSPHPGAPAHPFTPKVLRARERAPILYSSIVFTLDSHLNLSKSLGTCQSVYVTLEIEVESMEISCTLILMMENG